MATIVKREGKTGTSYMVDIRITGYPRQKKTFRRLTDAKHWAAKTEAALKDGNFVASSAKAKRKTFSDALDRYECDVLPSLAQGTQESVQVFLRHWRAVFGSYALNYLSADLISAEMKKLAETPYTRKEGGREFMRGRQTLKHYRNALSVVLGHARTWGWLAHDPMLGVNRVTKIKNGRDRYLSDDERTALLHACRESDNQLLYPIVIFALSTGARKGEITKLTLADLDLTRGMAILRNTKNGETRSVPVVGHLHQVLSDHVVWVNETYDNKAPEQATRWLFPRRDLLAPIDIRKAWENARRASGVENFRFHDLRHSTASYLAMQGASLLEIADLLGHKTLQMVRRYAHLSDNHRSGLAQKLDERMFTQDDNA